MHWCDVTACQQEEAHSTITKMDWRLEISVEKQEACPEHWPMLRDSLNALGAQFRADVAKAVADWEAIPVPAPVTPAP